MSASLPTKARQEILTFGYIRSNADKMNVPVALNHLCLLVYNDNIHMILCKEKLKEFMSMDNGQPLYGNVMKIQGIHFQCILYANGRKKEYQGRVGFVFMIKNIPGNIKNITMSHQMFCPQKNMHYSTLKKVQHTYWDNLNTQRRRFITGWNPMCLSLSQCTDEEKLEFIACPHVLNIEYKDGSEYIKEGIKMNISSSIEWIFDESDLKMIEESQRLDGPLSMDNCWAIKWRDNKIGIALFQCPPKIIEIKAKFNVICIFAAKAPETLNWTLKDSVIDGCHRYKIKVSEGVPMKIKIDVVICEIRDKEGKRIQPHEWFKYNVLLHQT